MEAELCSTPTSSRIGMVLKACHDHRLIGVVTGPPGTSKTATALAYATRHQGATYLRMDLSSAKPRAGLAEIAGALHVDNVGDWSGTSEEGLVRRLRGWLGRAESPCLILDEAQHLNRASGGAVFEHLRDVWDTSPFGLVLLGNPALTEHWTERARGQFDQLMGRIGPLVDLKGATSEDVAAIARHHGVTDAEATDVLQAAALKPGGLHNVAQVLSIAHVLREAENGALSVDVLRRAALVSGVAK